MTSDETYDKLRNIGISDLHASIILRKTSSLCGILSGKKFSLSSTLDEFDVEQGVVYHAYEGESPRVVDHEEVRKIVNISINYLPKHF